MSRRLERPSTMTTKPRALVVAYDFPPHAAIGTMRTLRVVQQLAAEWDVMVLTSDPRAYRPGTPVDETLLARVPASVGVVRAGAYRGFERLKAIARDGRSRAVTDGAGPATAPGSNRQGPRRALRKLAGQAVDLVDAALSIPDHESGWCIPATLRGLAVCRAWRPDVIYSSAPPWTGQIVARALAGRLGCPWVADFRDPWSRAPWREGRRPFVRRANNMLERLVVARADAILFVTRANLAEFARFYGDEASRRFHLIPSGCDPSEFDGIVAAPATPGRFVLLHAGSLYGARNPMPLIHAIARAIDGGRLDRRTFRLRLLGPIHLDVDIAAACRQLGMEEVVELVPRVTRHESLREMAAASALLLVQPVTTVSVPGKAYEYLAAGRPLLALSEEGETAELVRASGIGVSVTPAAGTAAIEAALIEVLRIASAPYTPPPLSLYDGRVHAAAAADLLRASVDLPPARTPARARSMEAADALQPEDRL